MQTGLERWVAAQMGMKHLDGQADWVVGRATGQPGRRCRGAVGPDNAECKRLDGPPTL